MDRRLFMLGAACFPMTFMEEGKVITGCFTRAQILTRRGLVVIEAINTRERDFGPLGAIMARLGYNRLVWLVAPPYGITIPLLIPL